MLDIDEDRFALHSDKNTTPYKLNLKRQKRHNDTCCCCGNDTGTEMGLVKFICAVFAVATGVTGGILASVYVLSSDAYYA